MLSCMARDGFFCRIRWTSASSAGAGMSSRGVMFLASVAMPDRLSFLMKLAMNFFAASACLARLGTENPNMIAFASAGPPALTAGKLIAANLNFGERWVAVSLSTHEPFRKNAALPCAQLVSCAGSLDASYPLRKYPPLTSFSTSRAAASTAGESQPAPDLSAAILPRPPPSRASR
ncbi:hypothetical protein EBO15_14270 [Actinomadura harenae]|uniref:Uncharacterized protein n=1 Tax=Actinomadura harenae TaxID=2483351 RepID=A0A3M2M4X8_9ACTN|nr:hypothetical protein EBO15_14270 [Actinomadura harenae]